LATKAEVEAAVGESAAEGRKVPSGRPQAPLCAFKLANGTGEVNFRFEPELSVSDLSDENRGALGPDAVKVAGVGETAFLLCGKLADVPQCTLRAHAGGAVFVVQHAVQTGDVKPDGVKKLGQLIAGRL
jgi:hypothetical protein